VKIAALRGGDQNQASLRGGHERNGSGHSIPESPLTGAQTISVYRCGTFHAKSATLVIYL
jgi:hypothetical protein